MNLPEALSARHQRIIRAEWELTQECPWRCVHCYLGPKRLAGLLSLAQCERVLDELAAAGAAFLLLTGGEPTLHPHFWELVRSAQDRGFRVRVFSNLTHLRLREVDRLAAMNLEAIEATFLGSTPELHDRLARKPGSFDRLLARVKRLRKRGARVHLKTVYLPANLRDYGRVEALARRLGCAFAENWQLFHRLDTHQAPACGGLNAAEFADLLRRARRAGRLKPGGTVERHPCGAGVSSWALDPRANVYPCLLLRIKCGNLLTQSWRQVYRHPCLRKLREAAAGAPGCRGCALARYCRRCKAQAWLETGDWRKSSAADCLAAAALHKFLHGAFVPSAHPRRRGKSFG
jgi:radical SAM protein with 4Fe4S-binding SPASM domain